jgi:SAM-dependent methyltransferase
VDKLKTLLPSPVDPDDPGERVAKMTSFVEIGPDLSKVLRVAGYTDLGPSMSPADGVGVAPNNFDAAVLARRLASPQLCTLVELFLVGAAVPRTEAADALHPLDLDAVVRSGLLTCCDERVQAGLRIGWCDGLLVAHDWQDGRPVHRDHVVGVGQASLTLADLTVRLPGVDVLDVGTGGGVQAFLAARHARTVTGTDINPRALEFAAFGAALNNIDNVAWREGSLFEPVCGQRYDLVTANPPFIISPDTTYLYRDGDQTERAADGLSRRVVIETARALRPGGWASLLCSWIHSPEGEWSAPVRSWLAGLGCDVWVLRFASHDPLGYAETWLAQTERSIDQFNSALDRWIDCYREQGIGAIATGAVIMRRRQDRDSHIWADDMPTVPTGSATEQIQRAFDQQDRMSGISDGAGLLDEVLAPVNGTRLEQTLKRSQDGYEPTTRISVEPGLTIAATVPSVALPAILELDGKRPLSHLIRQVVANTGFDADEVFEQTLATARRLVCLGLIDWRRRRNR